MSVCSWTISSVAARSSAILTNSALLARATYFSRVSLSRFLFFLFFLLLPLFSFFLFSSIPFRSVEEGAERDASRNAQNAFDEISTSRSYSRDRFSAWLFFRRCRSSPGPEADIERKMADRQRRSRYLTISILHIITIMCQGMCPRYRRYRYVFFNATFNIRI